MGTGMGPPAHPSCGDVLEEGETWVLSASPWVAEGFTWSQCLRLGSLYSPTRDDRSAGLRPLDTSLLGEPLRADLLQPAHPMGNVGSRGPAPAAAGSDHPHPVPTRHVAEHDKEVQQLCEALEQQIHQEQQQLQQEVGHQLLLSPYHPPQEGTQHPQTPVAVPRWASGC